MRADAKANRNRLIEVAREGFGQRGLALSIHEIARNAGVGVGTVYRHFPTKEALVEAIAVARLTSLLGEGQARLKARDPGTAFFDFLALLLSGDGSARGEVGRIARRARPTLAQVAAELRSVTDQLLQRAHKVGAVRADVGIEEIMALARCVGVIGFAEADLRRKVWQIMIDGLRSRGRRRVAKAKKRRR